MSSLRRIWRDNILQLSTKIRLYQALVMSVLLYAAEIWALLSCDEKTLEAFHMECQRQILHIHWSQHVTNAEISARTGLPPVMDFIRRRRLHSSAHSGDSSTQRPTLPSWPSIRSFTWQGLDWRRRPGRPPRAGQTNSATTLDLFLPTSGDRPSYGAMVERRDSPSWLRDDDDDVL